MNKIIYIFASITLFVNVQAQNTGKKEVSDFNAIEVSAAARVNLIQGDSNYVTLASKDSIKKTPKMEIKGGVLQITSSFRGTIDVHVKNITSIRVSDAARVSCKDTLRADNLTVHVSDAARADILVHAKMIKVKANDAGSVTIGGTVDSLDAKASDASHINGASLKAGGVRAVSSDGSNINVWAINSLDAKSSDGSNISVIGNPAQKNTIASDGGSVKMENTGEEVTPKYDKEINIIEKDTDKNGKKKEVFTGDAFIGGGFVTGGSNGAHIKYGSSREFMMGFGGGHMLTKWNELGFDVYYKSTDFYLAQNAGKSFPDTIHHQAEKVSVQNFGGLVFDRFFLGKKLFLDGGFYGEWTFHSKHVTWDDNAMANVASTKTIDRNLSYVNADNYGLTFRLGQTKGVSLYFNYRLSKLFQNTEAPAPAYPQLPVYVVGINIGGF